MADNYLIDVNICLDVLLKRELFWRDSAKIFQAAENNEIRLFVSAISFDTIFYILSSDIGASSAQRELNKFRLHISVAPVDGSVVDRALDASWKDLKDALQYYSAAISDCKALISRNKRDYPVDKTQIPILSPTEFISKKI